MARMTALTRLVARLMRNSSARAGAGVDNLLREDIHGRFARQLDTTVDDGNTTTGTMRVLCQNECATSNAYVALTPADDANVYTVCVGN